MIVEYNGDYWHCNPSIPLYSGSFFHPKKKKTAEEIWNDDVQRLDVLQKNGYHVFVVWESEYHCDKNSVLMKLVNNAISCSKGSVNG